MKKIFTIVITMALAALPRTAEAQNEPTTSWPYIYADFVPAEVYMSHGQKLVQKVNVHLGHSKMHYLDNETVRELILDDVVAVVAGADRYVPSGGSMYKVVASSDKGLILEQSLGDFAALSESGGAYGTSSAASATRKLSSVDAASTIGCTHMMLLQGKSDGQILPLTTKFYLQTPEFFSRATKKDLDVAFEEDRAAEWKAWLKTNKIKWNQPESLKLILEFLK